MKQGLKPTRKQRERMKALGLNPEKWRVAKVLGDRLILIHRETGQIREMPIWKE